MMVLVIQLVIIILRKKLHNQNYTNTMLKCSKVNLIRGVYVVLNTVTFHGSRNIQICSILFRSKSVKNLSFLSNRPGVNFTKLFFA